MLDIEDDDLLGGIVYRVVNEIGVFWGHEFAHTLCLLKAADIRKQDEVLQALIDRPRTRSDAVGFRSRM